MTQDGRDGVDCVDVRRESLRVCSGRISGCSGGYMIQPRTVVTEWSPGKLREGKARERKACAVVELGRRGVAGCA